MKHKDCNWCGEKLFKSREHECPKIFIDEIIQKGNKTEYRVKGENISIRWKGKKIIIFKEGDSQ